MTVKVNQNFYRELDRRIEKGLLSSAEFLKDKIKKKISRNIEDSSPGEPPSRDSGELYRSIKIDKSEISRKKVSIGTDKRYGLYLEAGTLRMQSRPYLRPALRENKIGLIQAFIKGAKR